MTAFIKENFAFDGMYLKYDGKFVARFKHCGPVTRAKFTKALIKRYTTEDYFAKMDQRIAPLQIMMNDGVLVFDDLNKKFILDGKVC